MPSTMQEMKKSLPPSRTAPQFVVRFPDEWMRDRIKRDADEQGRSMNAQILFMLQRYFDDLDKNTEKLIAARKAAPPALAPSLSEGGLSPTDIERLSTSIAEKLAKALRPTP